MKQKFILQDKDNTYFQEFMDKDNVITSKNKKDAKKFKTDFDAKEYKRTKLLHDFHVEILSESVNIKKYSDFLNEEGDGGGSCGSGDGGGTAFAGLGQNGMGNIVSPQTGTIAGSLWQGGSGTIGSGDRAAYDMKNKFDFIKKKDKKKIKKSFKSPNIKKFSDWLNK